MGRVLKRLCTHRYCSGSWRTSCSIHWFMDKLPADLKPAFQKAVADATAQQRAIASDKGSAAIEELKKKGIAFHPMSAADRASVRQAMSSGLWASFAKQYPPTAPLFAAIQAPRG